MSVTFSSTLEAQIEQLRENLEKRREAFEQRQLELEAERHSLDKAQETIDLMEGKLGEIQDAEQGSIVPSAPSPPKVNGTHTKVRRTRGRNASSLRTMILDILKKHRSGLELKEIVAKTLEAGYDTKSGNFAQVVYQQLHKLINDDAEVTKDTTDGKKYKLVA